MKNTAKHNPAPTKVWDPLLRLCHWSLVVGFTIAYLTEDDLLDLHVYAGYLVGGLVVFRLLWGLIGPCHARFSDFVTGYAEVKNYLVELGRLRAPHYLGHNPAGGWMVIALLAGLTLSTFTGLAAYAAEQGLGPLTGLVASGDFWGEFWEETHELCANLTLLLVLVHIGGVLVSSVLHGENLVRAMITGYKQPPPDKRD